MLRIRWTLIGLVPSSNVSATHFSVRVPCEMTVAGTASAAGGKQPWASAVGIGTAVGLGLGTTADGMADSEAAAVGVGPAVGVASAVREKAGSVSPEATMAATMTMATAPANARKTRVRRRRLGSMITFWPLLPQLLARRPNVQGGLRWWATLDSNQ